jgi:hypothetical protein
VISVFTHRNEAGNTGGPECQCTSCGGYQVYLFEVNIGAQKNLLCNRCCMTLYEKLEVPATVFSNARRMHLAQARGELA